MGKTAREQSHSTQQIDSRRLFENSFNQDYDFDYEDKSAGNVSAGGDVTIQSVEAAQAATQAAEKLAEEQRRAIEKQLEEDRKKAEAAAALEAKRAEEQRRTAEAHAEEIRKAAEAATLTAQKLAEEQRRATEAQVIELRRTAEAATLTAQKAVEENRRVTERSHQTAERLAATNAATLQKALEENRRTTESANTNNLEAVKSALDANENSFANVVSFLEKDEERDNNQQTENFKLLSDKLKEANELSTNALSQAFKSTVGGFADQQQQMLLIGFVVLAGVGAFAMWRGSRKP